MSVILKNISNSTIYTFPGGVDLVAEPFTKRLDTESRAFAHGGVIVSDQKIGVRIVSVHGIFGKASQALVETELNSMTKAVYTEDLRLYATQNEDDFYKVECLSFDHTFLGKITIAEINIDFICSDPFKYYKDVTTDTETVNEASESMTVTNGGDVECFPIITFTAGAGSNISVVRITNTTDAGKYFEYTPASNLTSGHVLEIDCEEGTVGLNGSDDMAHFNAGQFIKLLSGSNSLVAAITGTVGTNQCVFVFRNRWL